MPEIAEYADNQSKNIDLSVFFVVFLAVVFVFILVMNAPLA